MKRAKQLGLEYLAAFASVKWAFLILAFICFTFSEHANAREQGLEAGGVYLCTAVVMHWLSRFAINRLDGMVKRDNLTK